MTDTDVVEVSAVDEFKDRKGRLMFLGVIQILLGGLCLLLLSGMLMSVLFANINPEAAESAKFGIRQMIQALGFYILLGGWFICMGIGSIGCRRWARALSLVTSWLWLICGIVGMVSMIFFAPFMRSNMAAGQPEELPENFFVIMQIIMFAFMTVAYVIIPLVFVLLYSGRDVRLTCEYRDQKVRWTDRCPLPVLGVCEIFSFWLLSMSFMVFQGCVVPFFGTVLESFAGAAVILVMSVAVAFVVFGLYKLDIRAWWGALVLPLVWFPMFSLTFYGDNKWQFYEKLNTPAESIEAMKAMGNFTPMMMAIFAFWIVGLVGYLLYIKRYFKKDSSIDVGLSLEQV